MIELDKPIWLFDDRSKSDNIMEVKEVLWKNEAYVLCRVVLREFADEHGLDLAKWTAEDFEEPILFDINSGSVQNTNYDSWFATNDISWWRPFGWDGDE